MDDVKYNIREALKHYRYLNAFIENSVDSMEWYVDDYKISSEIRALIESKLQTMQYKAHMDRALEIYRAICEQEDNVRAYNVIYRKYIHPPDGADHRGKPFTNEQLAELFNCSEDTIWRDVRDGYHKLAILFFGINGMKP